MLFKNILYYIKLKNELISRINFKNKANYQIKVHRKLSKEGRQKPSMNNFYQIKSINFIYVI